MRKVKRSMRDEEKSKKQTEDKATGIYTSSRPKNGLRPDLFSTPTHVTKEGVILSTLVTEGVTIVETKANEASHDLRDS